VDGPFRERRGVAELSDLVLADLPGVGRIGQAELVRQVAVHAIRRAEGDGQIEDAIEDVDAVDILKFVGLAGEESPLDVRMLLGARAQRGEEEGEKEGPVHARQPHSPNLAKKNVLS
jgi:hypothetical protein